MTIDGKTFVITGAGSGIGREIALNLLHIGARVAGVDINEESLNETRTLASDHASKFSSHVVNITDKNAILALPKQIAEKHENIDGVINNAGIIQPFIKVNKLDYEDIDRVMSVNFYGMLYMTKTFLPILLNRPEATIANVSSMGGFLPVPGQTVYGASKAAVKLFTEGLSAELMDTNVHVMVVFPGATNTNITKNSGVSSPVDEKTANKFKALPASKAAEIIVRGIEKKHTRVFVGNDSRIMDRLYRLNPGYATKLIAKQMKDLLPS